MTEKRTLPKEGWRLYQVVNEKNEQTALIIYGNDDPEQCLDLDEKIETDCWLSDVVFSENIIIIGCQ